MEKNLSTFHSGDVDKETVSIKVESPQMSSIYEMTENSIKIEQVESIVKVEEESTSQHIDMEKCISSLKEELTDISQLSNSEQVNTKSFFLKYYLIQ